MPTSCMTLIPNGMVRSQASVLSSGSPFRWGQCAGTQYPCWKRQDSEESSALPGCEFPFFTFAMKAGANKSKPVAPHIEKQHTHKSLPTKDQNGKANLCL